MNSIIIICFFTLFLLFSSLFLIYKNNIFYPQAILMLVWFLPFLFYLFFGENFYSLSIHLYLGISVYCFGFYIGMILLNNSGKCNNDFFFKKNIYFILIFIIAILSLYNQITIFYHVTDGDFFGNLSKVRHIISIDFEDIYGIYKYGTTLCTALLLVQFIILMRSNALFDYFLFLILLLMAFIFGFLSTGRGILANILLMLLLCYFLKNRYLKISYKIILSIGIIFILTLLIFLIMGTMLGKVADTDSTIDLLINYLISQLSAFSYFADNNNLDLIDFNIQQTLRPIALIFYYFGFNKMPNQLVQDFVSIPIETNLYTNLKFYLSDFGYIGLYVISLIQGFFYKFLYNKYMQNPSNDFWIFIFAIFLIPLIQSVGGETFFSHTSLWTQYVLIGLLVSKKAKISY